MKTLVRLSVSLFAIICLISGCANIKQQNTSSQIADKSELQKKYSTKLSWFIPDGVRADQDVFKLFRWAKEGKLPNIKKMMELGSYGYSIPVFPSHTPTNFAALLTGTYPKTNGVSDGPMRIEGKSLQKPAIGGFSSAARKVPAIWSVFDSDKRIVLLSLPSSTPPELERNGVTIRGRWGGWGADLQSIIFEKNSIEQRKKLARNSRLFYQGMELTQYIEPDVEWEWPAKIKKSNELYLKMNVYSTPIYAKLQQSTHYTDNTYDIVAFSRDKNSIDVVLHKGEWSKWFPITVIWNNQPIQTNIKYHLIDIGPSDFFRVRIIVDSLNASIIDPQIAHNELESITGPMVDFVDNFPPQLIYYPEDKSTFISESKLSFEWHLNSIDAIYSKYQPDVFIHDIYSPNQMLTSKWWMGYIDPNSSKYHSVSKVERSALMEEVEDMYKDIDAIVGKTLENADENTLIVFSSDHGAIPLNTSVRLNNLFAKKGWITYLIDPNTGEQTIDWIKSKVVFLKMSNIYVNPEGLGPVWSRGTGPAYEKLRNEVIEVLENLKDNKGMRPLALAVKWENATSVLNLPSDRIGDIVVANKAGFGWAEDITNDLNIFAIPIVTGYKQAILADKVKGMWTPFIIMGKGIKKDHKISKPISNIDQAPTILRAMNMPLPSYMEGKAINEIFE